MIRRIIIPLMALSVIACNPNQRTPKVVELKPCPTFLEDSAYHFIEQQLGFGYRIPGTEAHQRCGDFLVQKLNDYGFEVREQVDTISIFTGKTLPMRNILASLNAEMEKRVLLCAHWDSRFMADQDPERPHEPIAAANDGASGVATILELARNMAKQAPNVGIDIIFFDVEDQGRPADDTYEDPNDHGYCMGSMYWAEHFAGPKPAFGILLDMVGAKSAQFTLEGYSMEHASSFTEMIWDMGNQLGHSDHFIYNKTQMVYDDHARINFMAHIPCVAIIDQDVTTKTLFRKYWHTHGDNLDVIDRQTLKAVGQTVMQVVYNQ